MTDRTIVVIMAHVPKGTEQRLLQYIRNYDIAHGDCHFAITVDRPDLSADQAIEMLKIKPGFDKVEIKPNEQTEAERAGFKNGFVGHDAEGHFVHYCHCGKWGGFGTGYDGKKNIDGKWFCLEHRGEATHGAVQRAGGEEGAAGGPDQRA